MSALPTLADKEARRVIAAAALMTSDKDGEALAAVRATCRLLEPHNLGPADIFRAALAVETPRRRGSPPQPERSGAPPPASAYGGSMQRLHVTLARQCLKSKERLSDWEIDFLTNIMACATISKKQKDRLQQIVRAHEMRGWGQ